MNIEKTQKKDYAAPEMIEVELFHKGDLLLECSGDDECTDDLLN